MPAASRDPPDADSALRNRVFLQFARCVGSVINQSVNLIQGDLFMDDFLHNLRTGKRFDRNRKPHDGKFPGPDRQRNRDSRDSGDGALLKAISGEHIPALKMIMEGIANNQKRIADAVERRVAAEERKAGAMETIAKHIKEIFSSGGRQKEEYPQGTEMLTEKEPVTKKKTRAKVLPENNRDQV